MARPLEGPDRRRQGVPPQPVTRLLEELKEAYCFAEAVVTLNGEDDSLRERIRLRYGDEGLIEMALAIASCRVFPVTKRALGYAVSCTAMAARV